MAGSKYTLKDYKDMSRLLESEFKRHQDVARLTTRVLEMCEGKGVSMADCTKITPETIYILNKIWGVKQASKNAVSEAISAKNTGTTAPIRLTPDDKQSIHIVNDMNHQHDIHMAKDKKAVDKLYKQAKPLVSDISHNFTEYYTVWSKMKELEAKYIQVYKAYYAIKGKKAPEAYTDSDKKTLTRLYAEATTDIIPKFTKLSEKLDQIVTARSALARQFYSLYHDLPPDQRGSVTLPTTVFEVQKKLATRMSADSSSKPSVSTSTCIQKGWQDALVAGFNPTFYAPCHIARQPELVRNCSRKFDWPYIAYSPNAYQPWDPSQDYTAWMQRCMDLEHIQRPYIGV